MPGEHPLLPKSALSSPPSLRLRRRCARHPATSVTCRSMHRCGYTVPPVGSTKPHKAVCLWRRLSTLPLPLRLAQNELPPSAPPPSSFATAFVVLIVVCEEGEGGGETGAAPVASSRVSVGTRQPRRELRCSPLSVSVASTSASVSVAVAASVVGGSAACPAKCRRLRRLDIRALCRRRRSCSAQEAPPL